MSLIHTQQSLPALILRLALGGVMFPHGAQKVLGIWGGHGFSGTLSMFTESMGIPFALAALAIVAEFFGALGLIFGFLTRIAAFGIACVMGTAVAMVHWQHGFFMNWYGTQAGEGFEYHLLAIGMALALIIVGGGTASVDLAISSKQAP